jgi:hypothetical protein
MKKLNHYILIIGLLVVTGFSSCMLNCVKGSGNEASEDRKVGGFTKLDVSGGYKIILKQDSSLTIHVTADDNVLKYIRTEVNGDVLKISTKKNICAKKAIALVIGIRNLEDIKGSGAIEIGSDSKLNLKDISIKLSGAGKLNLNLSAVNVITEGSGTTEIDLTGQATSHTVKLVGTGKLNALDFVVGTYDVETTGASECKINVMNELNIHTTGASNIEYRGNPAHVNSSKTGAATIKKID